MTHSNLHFGCIRMNPNELCPLGAKSGTLQQECSPVIHQLSSDEAPHRPTGTASVSTHATWHSNIVQQAPQHAAIQSAAPSDMALRCKRDGVMDE